MPKILVVGGNAAGMTAASRARRLDPRAEITVLEKTPFISYSTCGIPYFLAGDVRSEDLLSFTPGTLKSERSIDSHVNVEVASILPSRKRGDRPPHRHRRKAFVLIRPPAAGDGRPGRACPTSREHPSPTSTPSRRWTMRSGSKSLSKRHTGFRSSAPVTSGWRWRRASDG